MSSAQRITRTGQFHTTVIAVESLSPRMRRITLSDDAISHCSWPLGCDIAIVLSGEDGREIRRRYTVRATDRDQLVVDAVLHGHGPGSTWGATTSVGDPVTFYGPRGVVDVPAADWYWALTDEAGLPAVAAVAEALMQTRAELTVFAEVADDRETYPFPAGVEVRWIPRGGQPAGHPEILAAALSAGRPPTAPSGHGFAYVLGESRAVVALRDELGRYGLSRDRIYFKGYWNLSSRRTR